MKKEFDYGERVYPYDLDGNYLRVEPLGYSRSAR